MSDVNGGKADVFISYAAPDEAWALWVAAQLRDAGYSIRFMAGDSVPGTNFVGQMHRSIWQTRRTVALYSTAYLASGYCEAEWTAAWTAGKLVPFRIEEHERVGLFAPVTMHDLFDLDEPVARQRLLDAVPLEARPKIASRPFFPGGSGSDVNRQRDVRFPGVGTMDRRTDGIVLPVAAKTAQLLTELDAPGLLAVDDSILLYATGTNQTLDDVQVWPVGQPRESTIENPRKSDLDRIVDEAALDPDAAYLRAIAASGTWSDVYGTKVRLSRIDYERSIPPRPVRLEVAPLSQWIERQFNRRILSELGRNEALRNRYDSLREGAVRSWLDSDYDGVRIQAPNVLYFEVCTVSPEGRVLVAKKRGAGGGSGYARSGRPWSCPLETGLEWDSLDANGRLGWDFSLQAGARREIKVEPREIRSVEWTGIALEGHLNCALLGVMHVDVDEADLLGRLTGSSDYDTSSTAPEFVDVVRVPERIFGRDRDGVWHTTARLRILLYLMREEGADRVRDLLRSARPPE